MTYGGRGTFKASRSGMPRDRHASHLDQFPSLDGGHTEQGVKISNLEILSATLTNPKTLETPLL